MSLILYLFLYIYTCVCVSVLCHSFYIDCAICEISLELKDQGKCYGCKETICNPRTMSVNLTKEDVSRKSGKACTAEIVNVYRNNWTCEEVKDDLHRNMNGDIQEPLVWCYRDTCRDGFHVHTNGNLAGAGLHYV